jgi:hypothetical protein
VPWQTCEDYLALGRELTELTGNRDILPVMLAAVITRGNICTAETFNRYQKEVARMGSDVVQLFDALTDGNFSRQSETIKSQEGTIQSLSRENEDSSAIQYCGSVRTSHEIPPYVT